jgi:alpha-maltose-1-phosphate synthase
MPRVAILRWIDLGQREMQNYAPLHRMEGWELLGIGSRRPDHDLKALEFPVVQPQSVDAIVLGIPGLHATVEKLARFRLENLNYMFGLDEYLKWADIVDVAETFHIFCRQVIEGKKKYGYKVVASVHENIPFAHENLGFRRAIKREIFANADYFRTHSTMGKEALIVEGAPADRIEVLPTAGVDTQRFRPMDKDAEWLRQLSLAPDDLVILFVGRLTWAKGAADLLYAFRLLLLDESLKNHPLKLVIVGDGEEYDRISGFVDRFGLGDKVRLVKRVPYQDMPKIHNIADIYVLPSIATPKWQEQFGAVLAESMGCGKPVVGASSGSIPEVLGEAGVVYKANDFGALAVKLKELIVNADLRRTLGARGRERVLEMYDSNVIANRIRQMYEKIL